MERFILQQNSPRHGGSLALCSAALYGASFPLSKILLDKEIDGVFIAGIYYISQAAFFFTARLFFRADPSTRIRKQDWKWLSGTIIFGGVLAPACYLLGQKDVDAHVGALLSPTEIIFTTAAAVFLFREKLSGSDAKTIVLIALGAVLVGVTPSGAETSSSGPAGTLLVLASFFLWGLDNNCTTRISGKDPLQIAFYKGLIGGGTNLLLAALTGRKLECGTETIAIISIIGIITFGISFVLLIYSMRTLGASKSSAIFGSNPAFGVIFAWLMLSELPGVWHLAGAAFIGTGLYRLIRRSRSL